MYSKRFGIHSTTLRSRVCARHPGVDGCAPDRQGNPCGLRLGRAHRQHRGAVAGAGQSHGFGQRLSDREPRGQQEATAAGCRARLSRTTFLLIVESGLRLQPRSAERRRRLYVQQDTFWQQFCADRPESQAKVMAVNQRPSTTGCINGPADDPGGSRSRPGSSTSNSTRPFPPLCRLSRHRVGVRKRHWRCREPRTC